LEEKKHFVLSEPYKKLYEMNKREERIRNAGNLGSLPTLAVVGG